MEKQDKYELLYNKLIQEQQELHRRNQVHIRNGIKCIIFIPLAFLALAFFADSGKTVFLTLWIVSMFLLSSYLIYVEYLDFQVQQKVAEMIENKNPEIQPLIGDRLDDLAENVSGILKEWRGKP